MMNTIVNEKLVSFKELEKKIYSYVCELAREITQQMLESYDEELAKSRDKKVYRGKGKRKTSIKTIYGEVEYSRNVYRTETEDGQVAHIFLLDQAMHMDKIGLISTNLAEKIALTVTESPYRVTAEQISSTCGQSISAGGVWNMMQRLGERIDEEKEKQNRSTLVNKTMLVGMEKSNDFHAKREACIRKKYAADEIGQRILNGDGGSWIKEPYDPDTIFQLDRYHIYQEILRKISNKDAQKEIRRLFDEEKMDEMLEYIQIYATSVASQDENDKSSKKAMELYQYLNNKDGLLPAVNWKYISVLGNAKNYGEKTITLNALESCSYGFLRHTEESYMLTCKIVPRETYDTFGILLKSDKEASGCLFLEFDKAMQRVSFLNLPMGVDPFWVQSCQAVPPATEPGPDGVRVCEKTMQIEDGKAIDVKIIVDHDMIEAFIDEQIAFTYRIYAKPEFETGIIAQDSNVEFYNLSISGK